MLKLIPFNDQYGLERVNSKISNHEISFTEVKVDTEKTDVSVSFVT